MYSFMAFLNSCLLLLGVGVYCNPLDRRFISNSFNCLVYKLIIFGSIHTFLCCSCCRCRWNLWPCLSLLPSKNTYLFLCRCRLYRFFDMYSLENSFACYCCCCSYTCCCCYCYCRSNWKFSFVSFVVFHCLHFFHSPYIVARCAVFFHTCYVYSLLVVTLTVVAHCSWICFCFLGWNFDWQLQQNSVYFVLVYLVGFLLVSPDFVLLLCCSRIIYNDYFQCQVNFPSPL